jgi:glutathione S-transferase
MSRSLDLYSFADVDRSGKVRWTACELGYEINEKRLELGAHREKDYLSLNPYAQIPAVVIDDETWIESSAMCISLAERHPEAGLIPSDQAQREKFWQILHLTSSTLEMPTVNYILASRGLAHEAWPEIVGDQIRARLNTFADSLPEEGYLCSAFSIADICAGYVLRVAIQAGLLPMEGKQAAYLGRLKTRPAAIESRIFDSL